MSKKIANWTACLIFVTALALLCPLAAQTRVDLRTQTKSADLSTLGQTKPVQTGTVLPATCSAGALFFRLDSPAGQNLYGCTATNIWSPLFRTAATTFSINFSNQTIVQVLKTTHGIDSPNIAVECFDAVYSPMPPVSVFIDSNTQDVQITFSASASGRCVLTAADPASTGGTVSAAVSAGVGIVMTEVSGVKTLSLDTASVPAMLVAAQNIGIEALPPATCSENNITVAGIAVGDGVAPAWPTTIPAGLTGIMWVRTANTLAVRLCNSSSAATPAISATFKATILRSF